MDAPNIASDTPTARVGTLPSETLLDKSAVAPFCSRWPARTIRTAVLAAVAVLLLRTWGIDGLFTGFEVSGGSMAPALLGAHREVTCGDCGLRFACNAEPDGALHANRRPAVCPNCGYARNDLSDVPVVAGDRVSINRAIGHIRSPRRWELTAFRHPQDPHEICVKRVVGLPGEAVRIRDGDIYINGRVARKPLVWQRELAVLVYDADRPPTREPAPPPRWLSEPPAAWETSDGRFVHTADRGAAAIDWLTYRHWQRAPGSNGQTIETPITNQYGYNQDRPPHPANVHPVRDVMLSFRLGKSRSTDGTGRLLVRTSDGRREFVLRLDPVGGRYELLEDGRPAASGDGLSLDRDGVRLEVSLFDQQFLFAVDGHEVIGRAFETAQDDDATVPATSRPLAIGSQGLGVEITHVRVHRDVYYTCPLGVQRRWGLEKPVVLGKNEYFVLGDNSAISADSRTWPAGPGVRKSLLLGKPFLAVSAARRTE